MQTGNIITLSRRAILRTTAAVAAVPLAALPALADTPTEPLIGLWNRRAALLPLLVGSDDHVKFVADRLTAIEEEMMGTPATSAAGLRVKIQVLREYFSEAWESDCLDGRVFRSVLSDAERLAVAS
jgi:hypothetical protein